MDVDIVQVVMRLRHATAGRSAEYTRSGSGDVFGRCVSSPRCRRNMGGGLCGSVASAIYDHVPTASELLLDGLDFLERVSFASQYLDHLRSAHVLLAYYSWMPHGP